MRMMEGMDRKELYTEIALESPFLQQVIDKETTFTEGLDTLVTGMEGGDTTALMEFGIYYSIMGWLKDEEPWSDDELNDVVSYYHWHTGSNGKVIPKLAVAFGIGGSGYLALGHIVAKKFPQYKKIAHMMKGLGAVQIGSGAIGGIVYKKHGKKFRAKVDDLVDNLYEIAAELDAEVDKVFSTTTEDFTLFSVHQTTSKEAACEYSVEVPFARDDMPYVVAATGKKAIGSAAIFQEGLIHYLHDLRIDENWKDDNVLESMVEDTLNKRIPPGYMLAVLDWPARKQKYVDAGFVHITKAKAEEMGLPYKTDSYSSVPEHKGKSLFVMTMPAICEL